MCECVFSLYIFIKLFIKPITGRSLSTVRVIYTKNISTGPPAKVLLFFAGTKVLFYCENACLVDGKWGEESVRNDLFVYFPLPSELCSTGRVRCET